MSAPGEDFRVQRRAGIGWILAGGVVAAAIWFAIDRLAPPLAGMESLAARMVFALKCVSLAVLFCLVAGVEAVAHERLVSPAFWIGYHRSAAGRGLGMSGMVIGMIQLLYVAYRFGGELAGPWGAAAPIVLFIALEAVLVWTTRSRP